MKLSLTVLLFLVACTKSPESPSDDYVLIEFASKLEEDYQKIQPKEDLNLTPKE